MRAHLVPLSAGLGFAVIALAVVARGYAESKWAASVDVGIGLAALIGTGTYRTGEMIGLALWTLVAALLLVFGLVGFAAGMPAWWSVAHLVLGAGYLGLIVEGSFAHTTPAAVGAEAT